MNNSVFTYVNQLVSYGLNTGLIAPEDKIYTFNQLMEVLQLEEPEEDFTVDNANDEEWPLEEILSGLLDYAFEKGLIPENTFTYRDLFDVKLMNVLVKRPSEVIREFNENYAISPKKATDAYFKQNCNTLRECQAKCVSYFALH